MNDLDHAIADLKLNTASGANGSGGKFMDDDDDAGMPGGLPSSMFGTSNKDIAKETAPTGTAAADSISGHTEDAGDDDEGEDEYISRSAARAALAANAKKNLANAGAAEREDAERRRSAALKSFQEEEQRQRELLLKKEKERQDAIARGDLDSLEDPLAKLGRGGSKKGSKKAPIAGLEMSDESDSEGSVGGFDDDDLGAKNYSPLFGNQQQQQQQSQSQLRQQNGAPVLGHSKADSITRDPTLVADAAAAAAAADAIPPPSAPGIQTQRSLSPIPSASGHKGSMADSTGASPKLDQQGELFPLPKKSWNMSLTRVEMWQNMKFSARFLQLPSRKSTRRPTCSACLRIVPCVSARVRSIHHPLQLEAKRKLMIVVRPRRRARPASHQPRLLLALAPRPSRAPAALLVARRIRASGPSNRLWNGPDQKAGTKPMWSASSRNTRFPVTFYWNWTSTCSRRSTSARSVCDTRLQSRFAT